MARVKVKSFVTARAIRELLDINDSVLDNAGEVIADRIYNLAKRGRRMKQDGTTESLPKLAKSTQRTRRNFTGSTGDRFDEGRTRSNLTLTGALLDSLKFESDERKQEIELFFEGQHEGDNFSNDQLLSWLIEIDPKYNVLTLNNKTIAKVIRVVNRALDRKLRANNRINNRR